MQIANMPQGTYTLTSLYITFITTNDYDSI